MDRQKLGDILLVVAAVASLVLLVVVALELGVAILLAVLKIVLSVWPLLLTIVLLVLVGTWLRRPVIRGRQPPDIVV